MLRIACARRRYNQFLMWTDIKKDRISRFTQAHKEPLHKEACVLVATYNMITHSGARTPHAHAQQTHPPQPKTRLAHAQQNHPQPKTRLAKPGSSPNSKANRRPRTAPATATDPVRCAGTRAADATIVMNDIKTREWGLLLLDEVHVVPAASFLKCTTQVPSPDLGLSRTPSAMHARHAHATHARPHARLTRAPARTPTRARPRTHARARTHGHTHHTRAAAGQEPHEARTDGDARARGRQDRRPQLPHRAEAVRGQLARPHRQGLHRQRAVRRGVVVRRHAATPPRRHAATPPRRHGGARSIDACNPRD